MSAQENKDLVRREQEELWNHTGNLDAAEELFVPGPGGDEQLDVGEHAEFGGQPDGELQPDGIEGVIPTQVITEQSTVPNNGRRHTARL